MSDAENTPVDGAAVEAETAEVQTTDWESEAQKWKEFSRKHEANAKANAEAAKKLREIEDSAKSDMQKMQERLAEAETKYTELLGASTRNKVALKHGLSESLASRLRGSTEEELEEDAKALLKDVGGVKKPVADLKQGNQGAPAAANDMNQLILGLARRDQH